MSDQTVREFVIFVSLITIVIIAGTIFLHLESKRSEYSQSNETEYSQSNEIAGETYTKYSQKLNLISQKYSEELPVIKKKILPPEPTKATPFSFNQLYPHT